MRLGLIADTHMPGSVRELWPEVAGVFSDVDLIIHAGDIQLPSVLDQLEAIAPTVAARGNNDFGLIDPRVEDVYWLEAEDVLVAVVHDAEPEDQPIPHIVDRLLGGRKPDVLVTGHTHIERIDFRDGLLQINPGSAVHPRLWSTRLGTVGVLDVEGDRVSARIIRLGETAGLRNPGIEYSFEDGVVTEPA